MEFSRRDFITAGCTAAAAILAPSVLDRARAEYLRETGSSPTGRKAQVNLNSFFPEIDFGTINLAKYSNGFTPTGGASSVDPWQYVNADGYPSAIPAGASAWRANTHVYYIDKESFFSGSVSGRTLTVTSAVAGKPLFVGQTITQTAGGTALSAQSRIASFGTGTGGVGTYTLTKFTPRTGRISMKGFIPWILDWQGTASINGGPTANGLAFPVQGWVGTNRIEYDAAALDINDCTFNLSVAAGSSVATINGLVGNIFPRMFIEGPGIPPNTELLDASQPWNSATTWAILLPTKNGAGVNPGVFSYALSNVPCVGRAYKDGDKLSFSIQINSITTTPSNIRVYRQDHEALLNAGQICAPHFIDMYQQYGRLRFMNWQLTNTSMLANWADRTPQTAFSWSGLFPYLGSKYLGKCPGATKNAFVAPNTYPGNPSSWVDKQTFQFTATDTPAMANLIGSISGNTLTVSYVLSGTIRIGQRLRTLLQDGTIMDRTLTAGSGTSWTISGGSTSISSQQWWCYGNVTAATNANPMRCTMANHGLTTGEIITIPYDDSNFSHTLGQFGGHDFVNFKNSFTVTVLNANEFTIPVDSTAFGTFDGLATPFYYQWTFAAGSLPAKSIVSLAITACSAKLTVVLDRSSGVPIPVVMTGVYDADLDVIIMGFAQDARFGLPYEAMVQIANEVNGPDPWYCMPIWATDSFVTSAATYIKANLRSGLKWQFELSNEVWNTGIGFYQTYYATISGRVKWSLLGGSELQQWYGWRYYHMIQALNTIYTGGKGDGLVDRIFGFRVDETFLTERTTAPATGISVNNLDISDELCFATYLGPQIANHTLPDAQTIYDYQQGFIAGDAVAMQSALTRFDQQYFCGGGPPLFGPITATINNGGASAGNILTVTNLAVGFPAIDNPFLEKFTVIADFGGSNPAVGTYIESQLTSAESGGALGKKGTYQLAGSAQLKASTTFSALGSAADLFTRYYIPNFITLANAHNCRVCGYEGGPGDIVDFESRWTSYNGNPINVQDSLNVTLAYLRSDTFAARFETWLNQTKALGMTHFSLFCLVGSKPNGSNIFQLVGPGIFGDPWPAKVSFDSYNAG